MMLFHLKSGILLWATVASTARRSRVCSVVHLETRSAFFPEDWEGQSSIAGMAILLFSGVYRQALLSL